MTASVPVRISDFKIFLLDFLLLLDPFLSEPFTLSTLGILTFTVRKKGSVYIGVFA